MIFLNKHKKAITVFLSVVVILYLAFLFVLPNVINLNSYKKDIQKIVSDSVKLDIDFDGIKPVTTYDLKAGVKIYGLSLSYPDKKDIASVDTAEVKISLLPLIFKTVKVSDVKVYSPSLSLVYTKDGSFDVVDYVLKNMEQQQTAPDTAAQELPVRISDRLPLVEIYNYKLKLTDEQTKNTVALHGENFKLDNAVMNKHFRVGAKGKILVNNQENVIFDTKISSFWPAIETASEPQQEVVIPKVDFINEIVKYNPRADIFVDLKLKEHNGHIDLTGTANADKISIVLDGKKLPDGYFHMLSKGHQTQVDSNLYVSASEKALLTADVSHGHKTKIDLKFKTDKISFKSIQKFAVALLNSLNFENDISLFNLGGYISSDFSLNTDMKDFVSSGYLKVIDGAVSHKTIPVNIKDIKADVDFSNNNLSIKNTGANVNGSKVFVSGTVDSKANADIKVESEKINIAPLFNAFAPIDLKKAYVLNGGVLSLNVIVKGQLADIEPNINLLLSGLSLKDRLNTFLLSNKSASVNIKTKGSSFTGDVKLLGSLFKINNPYLGLSAPSVDIKVTPDEISIVPFSVTMNSSKIDVSGSIKDYMKKLKTDVKISGNIKSSDLKNLLPKEIKTFIDSKGTLPVVAEITGDAQKLNINAQMHSDSANHFSPVTVKKMSGKPGLVNVSVTCSADRIDISDASLYLANKTALKDNFAYNKKGADKIAGLTGTINGINESYPSLRLNFSIPEQIVVSIPLMKEASLKTKGEVNIYGTLSNPLYKGFFSIKDINLPDFLVKVQDVDAEFNENTLSAKVQNLDINGTAFNIDTEASSKFSDVLVVRTMNVTSAMFDADKIFAAMDKINKMMPQTSPSVQNNTSKKQAPVLPVKISNGSLNIQNFKMKQIGGDFCISNITSNFTLINDLFKLSNFKANVYNGGVNGTITYNVATTAIKADIKGKGVNANNIVTVFAALKDQVMANADFSANLTLKGATYEEQMNSLNGKVNFEMKDGQLGSLGRFETFLKAGNLVSEGFIATKIGGLVNTIAPYNTGKFSYLNGDLNIKNGVAVLESVKMSGPHMSLLLTGDVNILSMIAKINLTGSLSPEIVSALGPITNLSVGKLASYIPQFGTSIAEALNKYNAAANSAELAKIPALTPEKTGTQSFKVVINGNLNNPASAVKTLQWLNTAEKIQEEEQNLLESVAPSIPRTKEELKQQVKEGIQNQLENNAKVQEIKQNKAVQTVTGILNFYKKAKEQESQTQTQQTENAGQ